MGSNPSIRTTAHREKHILYRVVAEIELALWRYTAIWAFILRIGVIGSTTDFDSVGIGPSPVSSAMCP